MGHRVYHLTFDASAATAREFAALNNPAWSGVRVLLRQVHAIARSTSRARFRLLRRNAIATGGTSVVPAPHRSSWGAALHTVLHDGAPLTPGGAPDGLTHLFTSQSGTLESAGGLQAVDPRLEDAVVLEPGESLGLELIDAGGVESYTIVVLTEEHDLATRRVHLASNTLPAAGAFTSIANATFYPNGRIAIDEQWAGVTLWPIYTRGAAGGYARLRAVLGNSTEESSEIILKEQIAPSPPYATRTIYLAQYDFPAPADGNPLVGPPLLVVAPYGATTLWVQAAEVGAPGTPGNLQIAYTIAMR